MLSSGGNAPALPNEIFSLTGAKICKMNNIAYSHSVIYIGKSSNGQNLYLGKYGRRKKFLI